MNRLPDSLDVLRTREFRLLFSGQAVSVLGDRMAIVALAFAVLEIGGSTSDVGLVLAAGAFPLVATVLAGGVVADRASRRTVMVIADLVRVASQSAMAGLLFAGAWKPRWIHGSSEPLRRPRPNHQGRANRRRVPLQPGTL